MTIGEKIKRDAVRDTKDFYLDAPSNLFFLGLVEFAVRHCGRKVLDLGCATGNYMLELSKRGYECVGVDVNPAYVEIATKRGLAAYVVDDKLPFPDKSFDSVIMFEVVEHLPDPIVVLSEARRVARKNIILSVPNCEGYDELKQHGLTYEHFLDRDHQNFFTEESIGQLLSKLFNHFEVYKGDPVYPLLLANSLMHYFLRGLYRRKLIKPKFFFRLYAVVFVAEEHEG